MSFNISSFNGSQQEENMFMGWDPHHRLIYWQACHILSRLGVPQETLETEFWELTDDDLQTSSAIMEPNMWGQRKKKLSWIWQRTSMRISNQATLVNECMLSTSMCNGY